jgi:hypothetical protein
VILPSLSPLFLLLPLFFSATNTLQFYHKSTSHYKFNYLNTQFYQYHCFDSNLIKDSPFQVSRTIHFLFELNFKMLFFIVYFLQYEFCLGIYLFYSFFPIEICCMNVWFVNVRVCLRFYKIIFVKFYKIKVVSINV